MNQSNSLREKCPNTEFFLVCIFLYLDWIWRYTEYSVRIRKNADQKKFRIWTLFTQCSYVVPIFVFISMPSSILLYLQLCEKCPNIFPYSVRIRENTDRKKLRIWTLFTQCFVTRSRGLLRLGTLLSPVDLIGHLP